MHFQTITLPQKPQTFTVCVLRRTLFFILIFPTEFSQKDRTIDGNPILNFKCRQTIDGLQEGERPHARNSPINHLKYVLANLSLRVKLEPPPPSNELFYWIFRARGWEEVKLFLNQKCRIQWQVTKSITVGLSTLHLQLGLIYCVWIIIFYFFWICRSTNRNGFFGNFVATLAFGSSQTWPNRTLSPLTENY